jgi:acetyltransferase-like isoleucine patch superfamily enzyme
MSFIIAKNCTIHPTAVIDVEQGFLGENSFVGEGVRIEGTRVEIGREAFLDRWSTIGGGSCFDPDAFLEAGDWLHMGVNSHINTARGVSAGHEFGCGIETKIFTHGAYLDSFNLGAPVQWAPVVIGNNVWLPNAWVNPGVTIGNNVVAAARSLINKDLPSGCLAGGVPAQLIKTDWLPRTLTAAETNRLLSEIVTVAKKRYSKKAPLSADVSVYIEPPMLIVRNSPRNSPQKSKEDTVFDIAAKTISGAATADEFNLILKDQLRRNGIRFRYSPSAEGLFLRWS